MIGYITLGTNDFDRACAFYDALFLTIGVERLWSTSEMTAWGQSRSQPALCLGRPFDKQPASVGNGVMVALKVQTREEVKTLHAKAIELGGADEGAPGPRGTHGFYGGYFRDLDGNKLNAYVPAS